MILGNNQNMCYRNFNKMAKFGEVLYFEVLH